MFRISTLFTAILSAFFSLTISASETSGVTAGNFRVSEQGATNYSIPISLPAGTAGVTPSISINYSNQSGDGTMGMGWNLSAGGAISRCAKTIAQDGVISGVDLSSDDRFCLNGQRLMKTSGTHARDGAIYHTELDSFVKVEAHGNATDTGPLAFTVETKSGEVHYYGYVNAVTGEYAATFRDYWNSIETGSDAFIEPKNEATKSVAQYYLLKAIKDVSDNYILYEYIEAVGGARINRVSYTGNSQNGQKPYAYAQMNYATKHASSKRSGYSSGFSFLQDRLLTSIDVKLNNQSVHYYDLDYDVPTLAEESYTLDSIQECSDSSKNECYPATTFDWHKPAKATDSVQEFCEYEPGLEDVCWDQTVTTDYTPFGNQSNKLTTAYSPNTNQVFDMNGDGFSDIIYTQSGWYKIAFGPTYSETRDLTTIGDQHAQYLLNLDYNGDGKRDLLIAESATSNWNIISFEEHTTYENICWTPPGGGGGVLPFSHSSTESSIKRIIPGEICEQIATTSDLRILNTGKTATGLLGKAQIMDIDGDGFEDIVYQSNAQVKWYKNNEGTFAAATNLMSFTNSNSGSFLNNDIEKHTANMKNAAGIDINGDGRSDLIVKVTDTVSSCMVNGSSVPAFTQGECQNDILGTWTSSSSTGYKLYTSNGSSLIKAQDLGNYEDVRVADLNGDGLTDLLQYNSSSNWTYRLSDGRGLLESKTFGQGSTSDTYKNQSYFIDLNGDGAADFLKATSNTNWNIYITQYSSDKTVTFNYRGNISRSSNAAIQFGDVDGDGKLDLLQGLTGSHGWKVSYAPKSGKPKYAIKTITNGFGVKTEISYRPMTDDSVYIFSDSDANISGATLSPMMGMSLVNSVTSDTNDSGDNVSVDYQYGGLLIDKQGRGNLGFQQVRTIDNQTLIETETVYSQTFPHIGMPFATRQMLSDGRVISDAGNTLADKTTANGQILPYILTSTELSWSIGSDDALYEINKTVSDFTYDTYGNLTDSTIIVSAHNGTNSHTTTTDNEFTGSVWEKRMGRLKSAEVEKTRNNLSISRTTDFTYYSKNHSTGKGMLHTSIVQSTLPLTTTYEYDTFGNKDKVTKTCAEDSSGGNVQNREATSFYSNNGRLVDHTFDSAGIRTNFSYNGGSADSLSGRITETSVEVNGITQTTFLDDWGRGIESTSPGGSATLVDYDLCSAISCSVADAHYRVRATKSGAPESRAYFDTFGREIESWVKSFSGGWNIVRSTFDDQGRADKRYEPTTSNNHAYTEPTYDLYGRVTQIKQPDGTNIYTDYYGFKTKVTDAKSNVSYQWKNEQGELDKTEDAKGGEIRYDYNAYGNLLQVNLYSGGVGAAYVQVINTFDDYGRKTQTNDKDKGIWDYDYNAFDELVKQTNAKNQVSDLDYDDAGRLVRRYEPAGTSCWNYNSTNGRLDNEKIFNSVNRSISQCSSYNNENHRKTYFYDQHGRIDQTDVRIQSINSNTNGTYSTSSTFDNNGRIDEITYPNNLAIKSTYQNGYLDQIKSADTNRVYQNINAMNARGQVTSVNYANGASETIGYQSNNGRVFSHSLNKSGNKHLLTYQYDNNGNIDYRRHEFNDKGYTDWNETLTYDNLNRLDYRNVSITDNSYLTSGFKTDQNYNYDNWGNITYKTDMGSYAYSSSQKNRLTSVGSYSMTYDDNGNITNDGNGRSFTYHSFDKVNRITKGSSYSDFEYAADRARYFKRDRRTENSVYAHYYTTYIGGYEKIHRTGGGKSTLTEEKVTIGNIVITERSDGTDAENYLHKDHLGSTISVTDKVGSVVQQFTYDPWGKQTKIYQQTSFLDLTFNQPTNRGYTGHEHIDGLDIVHMNGRIYDANIGRFMQADPNIQSPGNFQNYNRYSYVLNNPLSLTDPSGFFFKKLGKFVKKNWRTIASIVIAVYMPGMSFMSGWTAAAKGALTGFVAGGVATGSLRGALVGALTGAAFGGIHDGYLGKTMTTTMKVGKIALHGLTGGVGSVLNGGKFGHGFFAAGFTQFSSMKGWMPSVGANTFSQRIKNSLAAATLGGTVSRLTGGKFASGAVTGAFSRLLNDMAVISKRPIFSTKDKRLTALVDSANKHSQDGDYDGHLPEKGNEKITLTVDSELDSSMKVLSTTNIGIQPKTLELSLDAQAWGLGHEISHIGDLYVKNGMNSTSGSLGVKNAVWSEIKAYQWSYDNTGRFDLSVDYKIQALNQMGCYQSTGEACAN